jgi:hypothetical protein
MTKKAWIIIGAVVVLAIILQVVSYHKYSNLQHNVAALKTNFALAKNDDQAQQTWQGFVKATNPALHGQNANAFLGLRGFFGKIFGGGSSSTPASTQFYEGSSPSGDPWASYVGSDY